MVPKELTTERKLGIAFAIALITLSGLAVSFYRSTQELFRSNAQVANTLEMMMALGNTLSRLNEAETSQRGFILTGDDKFLAPYPGSVEAAYQEIQKLQSLTAGHAEQSEALKKLEPLVQARVARMEESISIRKERGFAPALEIVVTKKGDQIMREIREVIQKMQTGADAALERRYLRSEQSSRTTLAGFLILIALNFVLLSVAYIVVRRDLAARQRNIEGQAVLVRNLATANQQLRDFAHVVSHDLKAPLRGINSLATFLTSDYSEKLDEEGKEMLSLLSRRVQRMHDLIEGILDYSRLAQGEEHKTRVELQDLIQETWEMLSPPAHIRLKTDKPMPSILCDRLRIQQIFLNLLSNAIKFNDKPEGMVRVSSTENTREWILRISDNGPGIDARYFSKIFLLFQTLDARDDRESSGIGLAVVKRAVEMSGGKIWIESELGNGSTFFFSLPKER